MFNPTKLKQGFFRGHSKPKALIKANGAEIPVWSSFRVENNAFSVADSFEIKLPWDVTEVPKWTMLASSPSHQSVFLTGSDIPVEIFLDFPVNRQFNQKRIMYGKMDVARWNFGSDGEFVTLVGRNLTGKLIDKKTTEKYQNQTASQVATKFFTEHGLKPQVTGTSKSIGTYLNDNQAHLTQETTEWDLLLWLAQEEGFACRVVDNTGYFGPRSEIQNLNAEPLVYTWGQNILDLEIERSPQAARNIIVEVVSWHGKQRIVEKATSREHVEEKFIQRYCIPGITREQAQKRARAILEELSYQEMYGRLRTDWVPEFGTDRRIGLFGVGLGLSQVYYVTKVTTEGNLDGGISAEISFVNNYIQDSGRFSV